MGLGTRKTDCGYGGCGREVGEEDELSAETKGQGRGDRGEVFEGKVRRSLLEVWVTSKRRFEGKG